MHEGPNPCLDLPPVESFNKSDFIRRTTNAQKRLIQYPVRVRKIKRLRKQIKDLTKALNREKDYGARIFRQLSRARHYEGVVQELKFDNSYRYLVGISIGVVIGFILFATRLP